MNQSLLLFKGSLKLKLGISEGIVFNPASIKGKFNNRSPWDRPPKSIYFIATNAGCQITIIKDLLYLTPEIYFVYLNQMKLTENSALETIDVTRREFLPSFGIELKIKI